MFVVAGFSKFPKHEQIQGLYQLCTDAQQIIPIHRWLKQQLLPVKNLGTAKLDGWVQVSHELQSRCWLGLKQNLKLDWSWSAMFQVAHSRGYWQKASIPHDFSTGLFMTWQLASLRIKRVRLRQEPQYLLSHKLRSESLSLAYIQREANQVPCTERSAKSRVDIFLKPLL